MKIVLRQIRTHRATTMICLSEPFCSRRVHAHCTASIGPDPATLLARLACRQWGSERPGRSFRARPRGDHPRRGPAHSGRARRRGRPQTSATCFLISWPVSCQIVGRQSAVPCTTSFAGPIKTMQPCREPGIRPDTHGRIHAYVRSGRQLRFRRLPVDTPLETVRPWHLDTRASSRLTRRSAGTLAAGHRSLPAADRRPAAARGRPVMGKVKRATRTFV